MSTDDLRKRLAGLNRGPFASSLSRDSKLVDAIDRRQRIQRRGDLTALIPGCERVEDGASCYVINRHVGAGWELAAQALARLQTAWRDPSAAGRAAELHPELARVVGVDIGELLFVDVETCGFAGNPVFLIGTMFVRGDAIHAEQVLARSYSEEAAILARFAQLLGEHRYLVTYNGKSFDWPFLTDRATVCHIPFPALAGHCDLLHVARRRFKAILPDCKLVTLERYITGRHRVGDIAGSAIPAAYHQFVRTGEAHELCDIVHHNFLDLLTMTQVLAELL